MAALNEAQLQAKCRAKFPVVVIADEDYTTMTPTQIAAEWSAYSGGTDGVYLQNVAGTWAEMDPDLPKANDRGLCVFGGGVQYMRDCTFSQCVVGHNPVTDGWWWWNGGAAAEFTAKGTAANGLPYVEFEIDAESAVDDTDDCRLTPLPGYPVIAGGVTSEGDIVSCRLMFDVVQESAGATAFVGAMYHGTGDAQPQDVVTPLIADTTAELLVTQTAAGAATAMHAYVNFTATDGQNWIVRVQPWLTSVNTAFPSHFHCINTSTSAAAIIVPEVVQRPMVLDEPWWAVVECDLPVRNVSSNHYIHEIAIDTSNRMYINFTGTHVRSEVVIGNVLIIGVSLGAAAPGDHVKIAVAATAQTLRGSLNGGTIAEGTAPRLATTVLQAFGYVDASYAPTHGFCTYQNHSIGTGLVTDAQLIEWSTAA